MRFLIKLLLVFVPHFVQAQGISFVNVRDFGAVGDGTNEAADLNKAFDSGKLVFFEKNKNYYFGAGLQVPSGVEINGNGSTLTATTTFGQGATENTKFIEVTSGIPSNTVNVSIIVRKGVSSFVLPNASSKLSVGNLAFLDGPVRDSVPDDKPNEYSYYDWGWYGEVKFIQGDSLVYLSVPAPGPSINGAHGTWTATSLQRIYPARNVVLKNFILDVKSADDGVGIKFTNCINCRVENVDVIGSGNSSLAVKQGIQLVGMNIKVSYSNITGVAWNSTPRYSMNVTGHNITIQNCLITAAGTGITAANRNYFNTGIEYLNNTIIQHPSSRGGGLDMHANSSGLMQGNTIVGSFLAEHAIHVRESNTDVVDNKLYLDNRNGTNLRGIILSELVLENVNIKGNKVYIANPSTGDKNKSISISTVDPVVNLNIEDNYLEGIMSIGRIGKGLYINNNTLQGSTAHCAGIHFTSSILSNFTVTNNKYISNWPNNVSHSYNFFIKTPSTATKAMGLIKDNKIWINNSGNDASQIRLENQNNLIQDNLFYMDSSGLVFNTIGTPTLSINSNNIAIGNKRINSNGVITITGHQFNNSADRPIADAFNEGRSISVLNTSNNTTTRYTCVRTGASTYSWQKIALVQ